MIKVEKVNFERGITPCTRLLIILKEVGFTGFQAPLQAALQNLKISLTVVNNKLKLSAGLLADKPCFMFILDL